GGTPSDVVAFGSGFVAVGAGPDAPSGQTGGMWKSADGNTWTDATVDLASAHLKAVSAAGGKLIAAGEHCTSECIGYWLWSSADGQAWSGPAKPVGAEDYVATGLA